MKIALITPNYMYSRTFLQPPVELYIMQAVLADCGHDPMVFDFRVSGLASDEALEALPVDMNLAIVSISPYDMTQMYHMDYRYEYAVYFVKKLKERFPCSKVIAVGAQCTLKPSEFIEDTGVDFVVLWEPERTVKELVGALASETDNDILSIPNLIINSTKGIIFTKADADYAHPEPVYFDVVPHWEKVNLTAYHGYDLKRGERERINGWGVVLASRGCLFNCSYCFNFFSRNVRFRDIVCVVEEVQQIEAAGAKRLFFLDFTFTQNREWVIELCHEMVRRQIEIPWLCQTRCDCVDEELLSAMRSAGCIGVEFGVETFDDDVLTKLNKRINHECITKAFELCKQIGLDVSSFLMVGTPYESEQSINSTIKMLREADISFIPIVYTPRIGSALGNEMARLHEAHSWDSLLGLRGKMSDAYEIVDLIKDHSVLKGESMGTVQVNLSQNQLGANTEHHRQQFDGIDLIQKGKSIEDYIIGVEEKQADQAMPFASFALTSECPFSCVYCGTGGESTIGPDFHIELSTVMDVAAHLKRAGITKVRLTGGEPFAHPRFGDILRFLSEQGFYVLVNTNGLLVEKKLDSIMRTASNIHFAVSIDTLDPVKFDKVTNTHGCFDSVMRGVDILCDLGYLMRVNMVVGNFNISEVDTMISFCKKHHCDLKLQEIASVPFPNEDWDSLHVDLMSLDEHLANMADRILVHKYARSFGIPVKIFDIAGVFVTLKAMSNGSRYDLNGICRECPHLPCHEGLYDIYVLSDGSLAACRWCTFGTLDTLDVSLKRAIEAFRRAEYAGPRKITKMALGRIGSDEGLIRL